jgi:hypothetical protein
MNSDYHRILRAAMALGLASLLLPATTVLAQAPQPAAASSPTAAPAATVGAVPMPQPKEAANKATVNTAPTPRPYDGPSRRARSWIYAAIVGTVGVVAVILLVRHYKNNKGCGNCLAAGN